MILISSTYGFCQTQAKTEEAFVGFPSYWNLVVYYFYLLQPPLWLTMTFILLFSLMTFIPIHFIYPTRTKNVDEAYFTWISVIRTDLDL